MSVPGNNPPGNPWPIELLRIARRLKRERDEARRKLADAQVQLAAYQAVLDGAFPLESNNP